MFWVLANIMLKEGAGQVNFDPVLPSKRQSCLQRDEHMQAHTAAKIIKPLERASQGKQNCGNFNSVARSTLEQKDRKE